MRRPALLICATILLSTLGCGDSSPSYEGKSVIILGFDGLDFELTRQLMDEGRLPNFVRLEEAGFFSSLGTSIPPQSPVAWSNFITGQDSAGHGIFDFVHRDLENMQPYLSTSKTHDDGTTELLRKGTTFWKVLSDHGVPNSILRMPANYPVSGEADHEISGMGTPDLIGSYGTFTYYTTDPFEDLDSSVGGGVIHRLPVLEERIDLELEGPPTAGSDEHMIRDFVVYLDQTAGGVRIEIDGTVILLAEGQWSEWVTFSFPATGFPPKGTSAICRFYLKEAREELKLYVTPLNIDPSNPVQPISTPEDFAGDLADKVGPFYTQGMPEDTKALSAGVFDRAEFLIQVGMTADESHKLYGQALTDYQGGVLFHYFGHVDQACHMLWRTLDPDHPAYDPDDDPQYADVIPQLYEGLDEVVGDTLDWIAENSPQTRLVVMSDHGFSSWRRAFSLNTWLAEQGYLVMDDPSRKGRPGLFPGTDWFKTQAYGLGLNGLYLNIAGREPDGIVPEGRRLQVLQEIGDKLLAAIDPTTGGPVVTKIYIPEKTFGPGKYLDIGPDMLVGYAKTYRCGSESARGEIPKEVLVDNTDQWSGDHCMDHEAVPGILLSNVAFTSEVADLTELAPAILDELGVAGFPRQENGVSQ